MQPHEHVDRYVPANTNQGWGAAAIVILLVITCIVTATIIHKREYKHPTDVTWHPGSAKSAQRAAQAERAASR